MNELKMNDYGLMPLSNVEIVNIDGGYTDPSVAAGPITWLYIQFCNAVESYAKNGGTYKGSWYGGN